ncbi:MAG: DNA repair protein RecN [Bdellovibrionales bacterium]
MLVELTVKDFAIIDEVQIEFRDGLNILSGETGAGKSVLLKSLGLLMGGKASSDIVRTGAKQAVIQGLFDISGRDDVKDRLREFGIEESEEDLVVRRVVSANAKSKIYINSSLTTLNTLSQIVCPLIQLTGQSAPLIEITGQHDSKNLLDRSYHLDVLDHFAKNLDLRKSYQQSFKKLSELQNHLSQTLENQKQNDQRLDFLKFQEKEIVDLDLQVGEEEDLENSYKILRNSQKLVDFSDASLSILSESDDSAMQRLQKASSLLQEASQKDSSLTKMDSSLETAMAHLESYIEDLQDYAGSLASQNLDPIEIESRMASLRRLQKKYGVSVEEIHLHLESIQQEILNIENQDAIIENLEKEISALKLGLKKLAQQMSLARKKAAKTIQKLVNIELKDLNMKGMEFLVDVSQTKELSSKGNDSVEFLCKGSPKEQARALAKTASGGELSRILLSLKQVIGRTELPRTYLFDEVDTGVSGETAEKVGKKLRQISEGQQVICVTHLPQVAAFGDTHFYIEKASKSGRAIMQLTQLVKDKRVREIARLISGEKLNSTSIAHAKSLLHIK